jgi:AAA15 family ATPase/GTPase
VIKAAFDEITDISSENPYGIPSIYVTLKHKPEMLPIAVVSSGINKFISLLIAVRTNRGGVVLIDELENGIYFKMFPALWGALYAAAKDNRTQLFISTHSLECLNGVTEYIDEDPKDFGLIQIVNEEGVSRAYMATGRSAADAIEAGIEVRK